MDLKSKILLGSAGVTLGVLITSAGYLSISGNIPAALGNMSAAVMCLAAGKFEYERLKIEKELEAYKKNSLDKSQQKTNQNTRTRARIRVNEGDEITAANQMEKVRIIINNKNKADKALETNLEEKAGPAKKVEKGPELFGILRKHHAEKDGK